MKKDDNVLLQTGKCLGTHYKIDDIHNNFKIIYGHWANLPNSNLLTKREICKLIGALFDLLIL